MKVFVCYALEREYLAELRERLTRISEGIQDAGGVAYAHVRDGQGWLANSQPITEMMTVVFREIAGADLILLDLTTHSNSKRTGLNIELGYALGLRKPVLAIWKVPDRPNMTTDLAQLESSYSDVSDLRSVVGHLVSTFKRPHPTKASKP